MRILLVEDDVALADAVCGYLLAKAFVVDVAPSLADARGALLSVQYAAVLLDLHLGDGDGLSLLPQVRALREPPIVIVLTARDQVMADLRGPLQDLSHDKEGGAHAGLFHRICDLEGPAPPRARVDITGHGEAPAGSSPVQDGGVTAERTRDIHGGRNRPHTTHHHPSYYYGHRTHSVRRSFPPPPCRSPPLPVKRS